MLAETVSVVIKTDASVTNKVAGTVSSGLLVTIHDP